MDIDTLHQAIRTALPLDLKLVTGLELAKALAESHWKLGTDELLHLDDWIFVPNQANLCL